jgi:hypothetical protein
MKNKLIVCFLAGLSSAFGFAGTVIGMYATAKNNNLSTFKF